jgi:hypothetical protein
MAAFLSAVDKTDMRATPPDKLGGICPIYFQYTIILI